MRANCAQYDIIARDSSCAAGRVLVGEDAVAAARPRSKWPNTNGISKRVRRAEHLRQVGAEHASAPRPSRSGRRRRPARVRAIAVRRLVGAGRLPHRAQVLGGRRVASLVDEARQEPRSSAARSAGSPNMKSLFSSRLVPTMTGTRFQPSARASSCERVVVGQHRAVARRRAACRSCPARHRRRRRAGCRRRSCRAGSSATSASAHRRELRLARAARSRRRAVAHEQAQQRSRSSCLRCPGSASSAKCSASPARRVAEPPLCTIARWKSPRACGDSSSV